MLMRKSLNNIKINTNIKQSDSFLDYHSFSQKNINVFENSH